MTVYRALVTPVQGVAVSTPSDVRQMLVRVGGSVTVESEGATTFAALTDVQVSSPESGQVPTWDGAKWTNQDPDGAVNQFHAYNIELTFNAPLTGVSDVFGAGTPPGGTRALLSGQTDPSENGGYTYDADTDAMVADGFKVDAAHVGEAVSIATSGAQILTVQATGPTSFVLAPLTVATDLTIAQDTASAASPPPNIVGNKFIHLTRSDDAPYNATYSTSDVPDLVNGAYLYFAGTPRFIEPDPGTNLGYGEWLTRAATHEGGDDLFEFASFRVDADTAPGHGATGTLLAFHEHCRDGDTLEADEARLYTQTYMSMGLPFGVLLDFRFDDGGNGVKRIYQQIPTADGADLTDTTLIDRQQLFFKLRGEWVRTGTAESMRQTDETAPWIIGRQLVGDLHRMIMLDGPAGTRLIDIDPEQLTGGDTDFTDLVGNDWATSVGVVVDRLA